MGMYMKTKQPGKFLIIFLLFGIILIAILIGCSTEQFIENTPSPTPIPTETLTITITKTPRPTRTNTPTITSTFTITPNADFFQVEEIHVPIQDSIPDDVALSGNLLISDVANQEIRKVFFYNLEDRSKILLDERDTAIFSSPISPNMKWIYYKGFSDENKKITYLVIKNLSTNESFERQFENSESGFFDGWLNNNEILVRKNYGTQIIPDDYAYNPFTNSFRSLKSNLPEFFEDDPPYIYSWPLYNSTGQFVLYPSRTYSEPRLYLILFDSVNKKIIQKYEHQTLFDVGPAVWNYQKDKFFYVYKNFWEGYVTFALGDTNGNYEELAILQQEITSYAILQKTWSPDGRYVALTMYGTDINNEVIQKLFIFDIQELKIIIPDFRVNIYWDQKLVWSPDSTQIIIEDYSDQHENKVILFDLNTKQASILMKNTKVFSWVPFIGTENSDFTIPTITPLPTNITPSITPTKVSLIPTIENEDFSRLKHANSLTEAENSEGIYEVTREQILSGELIREAKLREKYFFNNLVEPVDVFYDSLVPGSEYKAIVITSDFFEIRNNSYISPCKVVAVYTYTEEDISGESIRYAIFIQAWKMKDGIGYLQYLFPLNTTRFIDLDQQVMITPFYRLSGYKETARTLSVLPDSEVPLENLWENI
jgi:hypothetical protein